MLNDPRRLFDCQIAPCPQTLAADEKSGCRINSLQPLWVESINTDNADLLLPNASAR